MGKNNWSVWITRMPDTKDQTKAIELLKRSNCKNKSEFIRRQILNEKFDLIVTDKNVAKFIELLRSTELEINKIGVNINQITRAINKYHTTTIAKPLLAKVETQQKMIIKLEMMIIKLSNELIKYKTFTQNTER